MKIVDLRCAVIGGSPVVRVITDEGIVGLGQVESFKPYLKPHILFYKPYILGEDPTNVERVMLKIRRLGSFKPWGAAVSAIEMALWDIAGKAAGIPVYKLLGGKVRDSVRAYNGGVRFPMNGYTPQDYYQNNTTVFTTISRAGNDWYYWYGTMRAEYKLDTTKLPTNTNGYYRVYFVGVNGVAIPGQELVLTLVPPGIAGPDGSVSDERRILSGVDNRVVYREYHDGWWKKYQ